MALAKRLGRPCLVLDLRERPQPSAVRRWASLRGVNVLNIAGPRESKSPGIYAETSQFLRELLLPIASSPG